METLVFGGTGTVGKQVTLALRARGVQVWVLTRQADSFAALLGRAPRSYADFVTETAAAWLA